MHLFLNFRQGTRTFFASSVVARLPTHRLYKLVDWDKVEAGYHAVVDPMESGSILYLTEQDYIRQLRVSLSNDHTLKVLAKAGTSRVIAAPALSDTPSNQNSPPYTTHPYLDEFYTGSRKDAKRAVNRVHHLFDNSFGDLLKAKSKFGGTVKSTMIPVSDRNIRTLLTRWFVELTWRKTGSLPSQVHKTEVNSFCLHLAKIMRTQGVNSVIQRMKIGLFVLNSYLGGKRLTTTQPLGTRIRLQNGLPSHIPLYARSALRSNSMKFIHTWVSLLNSYKAMQAEWSSPSLETITAPRPDLSGNKNFLGFKEFIPLFWESLKQNPIGKASELSPEVRRPRSPTKYDFFFTGKSGPNQGPAMLTIGAEAFAWRCRPRNLISEWLRLVGADLTLKWFEDSASVWNSNCYSPLHRNEKIGFTGESEGRYQILRTSRQGVDWLCEPVPEVLVRQGARGPFMRPLLRRLHALYEAAGKIRIIAIVDYWTQLVLKPLHSWMFSILKLIPQDATFDQEGKLREFSKRGYNAYWCYDLKAATDLIPLQLYEELFKPMLPSGILSLWLELLVGLPFIVPRELFDDRGLKGVKNPTVQEVDELEKTNSVKYTCGQPMGALSSWASMALVHHALVLYAAFQVGKHVKQTVPLVRWLLFDAYLILGDDIVIADSEVAQAYFTLCESLGIKIGLAKSYTDSPLLNFANQTFLRDVNISPVSLREELSVRGLAPRTEMALRFVRRGYIDLTKVGWVAPLIKLFVRPKTWELIQKDLSQGTNHPIVSWILSALLAPATRKLEAKAEASLKDYLATMSRKVVFWNKPIKDLGTCESSKGYSEFLRAFVLAKAKMILKSEETLDKRLEGFESFILRTAKADVLNILFMAYQSTARRRLLWWRKTFKSTLNLIVRGALNSSLDDYAYARFCDVYKLEELIPLLYQADKELPVAQSYEGKTLKDFFDHPERDESTKFYRVYLRQMELLRATEEIFYSTGPEDENPAREGGG